MLAHIHLVNGEFVSTLSEATGFKTGLALNKVQLVDLFPDDSGFKDVLSVDDDVTIRLHSADIDEIFTNILYHLGNVEHPTPVSSTIRLYHKYRNDPELGPIYMKVWGLFTTYLKLMLEEVQRTGGQLMNPEPFIKATYSKYGKVGCEMAIELIKGNSEDLHGKLSSYRRFEWNDTLQLEELFKSESLDAMYGRFIDQRFINYLHTNQDKLGEMHWRKFEGLTAEFFDREGYQVELGPGRNDGGIDVRVWKDGVNKKDPPLILVQCKRYKNKIDRTVVKALWADVEWEKADSGLIVTTSSMAPGAQNDCVARGYNIKQADKEVITNWLSNMKTPGTGVFMGT